MELTPLATRKLINNGGFNFEHLGYDTLFQKQNANRITPGKAMPLNGTLSVLPPKLNPGEAVIKNAPSGKDLMTAGTSKTEPSGNSKSSAASKLGGIVDNALQIGTAGLTFAGALHNSAQTSITPDEMIRNGGSGQVDGMSYDIQSTDSTDAMERASQERTQGVLGAMGAGAGFGGAVGSVAGPLGGAIGTAAGGIVGLVGGLFGSSSAKRKAEAARREAERRTIAHNEYGYDMALTQSLRNKEAQRYGGSDSQMLYAASQGLEDVSGLNNFVFTKKNVFTPGGVTKGGIANANVEKGEKLVENMGGGRYNVQKVTEGPDDTAFAMLSNNTSVMSAREKNPETGNTYAEDTEDYIKQGRLPELLASQAITRELKNTKNMINYKKNMYFAKNKFLPGLAKGWENLAVNGLGFITSLADYGMHKSQDVFNPDINPINKYEGRVVDLMSGRRANAYPVIQNLFENEAGERYRMNNSSALSAGQRTLANIANTFNTRLGRMNALLNVQNMINEYAKDTATMVNQMGTTGMNAKLQSDQINAQTLASSSAKKADLMMNDKRNMLDYATQFAKNNWERNQFDRMMELYWQQVKNDRQKNQNTFGTPSTWSLNGDVTEDQRFEKYAPTPFTSTPFVRKDKFGLPIKDPEFIPDAVKWSFNDMIKMRNLNRKRK